MDQICGIIVPGKSKGSTCNTYGSCSIRGGARALNSNIEIADRDNASRHVADANPGMAADLRCGCALFSTADGDVSYC